MTAVHVDQRAPSESRAPSQARGATVVFAAGLAGLVGFAAWCGRGVWFFIDEWVIVTRYHDGGWLTPFNGHLSIVPVAIYRALLETVGYTFVPYRVVGLACYAAVAIAVFAFARTRVEPFVAAIVALLVAWSSQSQLLIMFPLLANFTIPAAAVVVIWLLLERDRRSCDIGASALVALALATSSVGLVTVMTVIAELVLRRERRWWRWAVFAPPILLWGLWYIAYDAGHTGAGGTIGSVVSFAYHQFLATFVALAAGSQLGGVAVFCVAVAVVVLAVVRWRTFDRTAAVITVTFLGFLLLTAVGRNAAGAKFHVAPIAPDSERFVWLDGLLLLCLLVQCVRGRRMRAIAVAGAVVVLVANAVVLADGLVGYRTAAVSNARNARTVFVAVDALGTRADPDRPLPLGFIPVPTRRYQSLVRHFGSPAAGVRLSALGDAATRALADRWLVHDLGIRLEPESRSRSCRAVGPAAGGVAVKGPVTLRIRAGAQAAAVSLRRLDAHFANRAVGTVPPGAAAVVVIPRDHSTRPWFLRVDQPDAVIERCA